MSSPSPSSTSRTHKRGLTQVLGLAFGIAVTVGGCIGMGILRQPGIIAQNLPHKGAYLAVWIVGSLYILLCAVSVAELAAMVPKSGGYYVYIRHAFGSFPGFVTGWTQWLSLCSAGAAITLVFAEYLSTLIPPLTDHTHLVAVATLFVIALGQWRTTERAARFQEITTLVKGVAFIGLIFALLLTSGSPEPQPFAPALPNGKNLLVATLLAFQAILQTYDGWEGAIYFGGELRNTQRDLPRSLIIGTLLIIGIYLAVNISLLHALPMATMAGHDFAALAATQKTFGASAASVLAALGVLSVFVASNATTLQVSRVLYALATDGMCFRRASHVNRGGTPSVALWLSAITMIGLILTGTLTFLLSLSVFFLLLNYALLFAAVIMLRWTQPDSHRPYHAWAYPWSTVTALLGAILYLGTAIWVDQDGSSGLALCLLAISYPLYLLVRRFQ